MKTIVGFALGALATLVLATAADADVQDRVCPAPRYSIYWGQHSQGVFGVRAGTPCRVVLFTGAYFRDINRIYSAQIIEAPHNVRAVPRADGNIYIWPKPGFTGKDSMTVRYTGTGREIGVTKEATVTFSIDVY
jgi:hypothetical protein